MYLVVRCDCGRVLYANDEYDTKKCSDCGKVLKIKNRRVLGKTDNVEDARVFVQELQDTLYHNTDFVTADKIR